jgi:hypothetical protein
MSPAKHESPRGPRLKEGGLDGQEGQDEGIGVCRMRGCLGGRVPMPSELMRGPGG